LNKSNIIIKSVEQEHLNSCYQLILELAEYERAPEAVILSLEQFKLDFKDKKFGAWVALLDDVVVGMSLYYHIYSTWKGDSLHLEDLIVTPKHRGKGIGKMLLDKTVETAKNMEAGRMQWQVLDWNEPAINFYKNYPAEFDGEWINVKISGEDLQKL